MDMIDRQAAIDAADKIIKRDTSGNNDVVKAMTAWKSYIEQLPSAEPQERKTGRWIRDEFGSRCGACGLYAYRDKFDRPWESPFCPNCGARMEVEHD